MPAITDFDAILRNGFGNGWNQTTSTIPINSKKVQTLPARS